MQTRNMAFKVLALTLLALVALSPVAAFADKVGSFDYFSGYGEASKSVSFPDVDWAIVKQVVVRITGDAGSTAKHLAVKVDGALVVSSSAVNLPLSYLGGALKVQAYIVDGSDRYLDGLSTSPKYPTPLHNIHGEGAVWKGIYLRLKKSVWNTDVPPRATVTLKNNGETVATGSLSNIYDNYFDWTFEYSWSSQVTLKAGSYYEVVVEIDEPGKEVSGTWRFYAEYKATTTPTATSTGTPTTTTTTTSTTTTTTTTTTPATTTTTTTTATSTVTYTYTHTVTVPAPVQEGYTDVVRGSFTVQYDITSMVRGKKGALIEAYYKEGGSQPLRVELIIVYFDAVNVAGQTVPLYAVTGVAALASGGVAWYWRRYD